MKDGYYWVKIKGKWTIGKLQDVWFSKEKHIIVDCIAYSVNAEDGNEDIEHCEIGDYIETPDKYKG